MCVGWCTAAAAANTVKLTQGGNITWATFTRNVTTSAGVTTHSMQRNKDKLELHLNTGRSQWFSCCFITWFKHLVFYRLILLPPLFTQSIMEATGGNTKQNNSDKCAIKKDELFRLKPGDTEHRPAGWMRSSGVLCSVGVMNNERMSPYTEKQLRLTRLALCK